MLNVICIFILNVIRQSDIMLTDMNKPFMMRVIMMNVIKLNGIQTVTMPRVMASHLTT
jgi:hypothetical protein